MKSAKWMLAVTLLSLSSLMSAQTLTKKVVAQVPFDFVVGNKIMPAGEWVVSAGDGNILAIANFDARKSALSAATRGDENKNNRTSLVFERYAGQYLLSEIRIEGSELTYKLPVNRGDANWSAQNGPTSHLTLLATLK
jgi:hypothetical protein